MQNFAFGPSKKYYHGLFKKNFKLLQTRNKTFSNFVPRGFTFCLIISHVISIYTAVISRIYSRFSRDLPCARLACLLSVC